MLTRRELIAAPLAKFAQAAPARRASMLWDYFLRELGAADERRRKQLQALKTPAELERLRERVRRTLLNSIGGFPERTPLNAHQVGEILRPDYVIEKVIFESRPSYYVTANLYCPKSAGMRRPAVIESCGHTIDGKAAPDYQRAAIGLAKKGIIVLVFDPMGQGERLMYAEPGSKPSGEATREHVLAGKPCYLLGRTLAHFRVWDAIRAVDYLESRPEVDRTRLGMFGHSGGGMLTLLTAPLDDRLRAVMSCCAVTSFYHKTRELLIADPEQIVTGIYAHGIDHPELIAAVAPRAFLIGATLEDFVPIDGTRRTFDEVHRVFEIAGVPASFAKVETPGPHRMNKELREACCSWMLKHLAGETADTREPELAISTREELRCTPSGRVMDLPKARSVFDLNRQAARELTSRRGKALSGLCELLGLTGARPLRRGTGPELVIETEPGIEVPATLTRTAGNALLIVSSERGRNSQEVRNLAARFHSAGFSTLAVDLRGWGDTRPVIEDKRARFSPDDFLAYRSFELGRPLLGMRVQDLLAAVRVMAGDYKTIYVVGLEAAGIAALHAGALEGSIAGVAAVRSLISYQDVFERPRYAEPVSSFVPGALLHYDLTELASALGPRPCVILEPRNATRQPVGAFTGANEAERGAEILKGLTGHPNGNHIK